MKAERFRNRFGGSLIFGVEDSHGRYTDVVSCSGYSPTCTAITSYRGWPVRIVFGSDQICDYREIAASTQLLFDRFYLDETERSSGQEDRLWFPAEIREARPRPDTKGPLRIDLRHRHQAEKQTLLSPPMSGRSGLRLGWEADIHGR